LLNADDFNQVDDAGNIVFLVLLARQTVDLDGHSRVWLFLFDISDYPRSTATIHTSLKKDMVTAWTRIRYTACPAVFGVGLPEE
jgi:hypothetical protein